MATWGENPIQKLDLTQAKLSELEDHVVETARSRKANGVLVSEADFFSGAMSVLERFDIDCMPWIIMMFTGQSIITRDFNTAKSKPKSKPKRKKK